MIEDSSGDMFAADVAALVNPVNTVGVMGKGLALAFKQRFPSNFAAYKAANVTIGNVFVYEIPPRWILNFPTKRHWRDASRIDDVHAGLVDLVTKIDKRAIGSVAIPALGCGLGGLEWTDVRPMIVEACAAIPEVRVVLFGPR